MSQDERTPQDTGLMKQLGTSGPLCPRSLGMPVDPAHALVVTHQNLVYDAIPKAEDGDPTTPELEAVSMASSYGFGASNRMRLYRQCEQVLMRGHRVVTVESWWYQCHVCGLILPATRLDERL